MKGRRPRSSERLEACWASSRACFRASNWARRSESSVRKLRMRSLAFSCFAGFSSCRASDVYSSRVREKAVSDAETEPSAAGVGGASVEERFVRSRFREVDCLSAELNCVFYFLFQTVML